VTKEIYHETFHIKKVMKENGAKLVVKLKGTRRLAIRIWIGSKLIKLAAPIMWCGIEITDEFDNEKT
jgi:hypothetical protein